MLILASAIDVPLTSADRYLPPGGEWGRAMQTSPQADYYICPVAGILRRLFFRARTTGAGPGTITVAVLIADNPSLVSPTYIPTGISLTVSQNSNLEGMDIVNQYAVNALDKIAFRLSKSAAGTTIWQEPSLTLELDNT